MFKLKPNMNRKAGLQVVNIYAFCGVMGSGKGYECQKLIDNKNFIKIDFADSLREMVWSMFNWRPLNDEQYDLFKKGQFDVPGYGKLDGRLILQRVGALMREIDNDFWVKEWKKTIDNAISMGYNDICCSDVRYDNEVEMIKSFGWKANVKIQFCDFHSDRYNAESNHESEAMAQRLLKEGYKDGDLIYGRNK